MNGLKALLAEIRDKPMWSKDLKAGIERRFPGGQWAWDQKGILSAHLTGLQERAIVRDPRYPDRPAPVVYFSPLSAAEKKVISQSKEWAEVMEGW